MSENMSKSRGKHGITLNGEDWYAQLVITFTASQGHYCSLSSAYLHATCSSPTCMRVTLFQMPPVCLFVQLHNVSDADI